ncbi:hypothetical protein Hanom_Chr15g01362961 [Helianthus anomalus]
MLNVYGIKYCFQSEDGYPFHEVRRKRDRKKENVVKEFTETRWKPGMQGRGSRGGRGNYSSRHNSHAVLDVGSSFMQGKMFQGDGPHNMPQQVIGPHKGSIDLTLMYSGLPL